MKTLKILITGATGFIGSHLAERLVEEKHKIKVLIRNSDLENTIRKETLELLKRLNVEPFFGDLLDKNSLDDAVKDIEIIFPLLSGPK